MNIEEFRILVQNNHRIPPMGENGEGDEVLTRGDNSQEDQCIREALAYHSQRHPVRKVAVLSLVNGEAALSSISGWTDGWTVSEVKPQGSSWRIPSDQWEIDQDDNGAPVLRVEAAGDVKVYYSRPHEITADSSTLRVINHEAVAHLAAHYCLLQASKFYAQKSKSSIGAESVEQAQISSSYYTKAKDALAKYKEHVRGQPRRRSAIADWDSRSQTGHRLIFRDGRYR